jgi:DNA-binding response OmpR family regulator
LTASSAHGAVVIEDDAEIRHLIAAVLERAGLHVVATANGREGVAAVRETNPVVITVDIRMPGIDGIETIRRIRSISDALIVVVSAVTATHQEDASLAAGADLYMTKPFRPRDLQDRVDERLQSLRDV